MSELRTSCTPSGKPALPASHAEYRRIFDSALKVYEEKTGKDLATDPLLRRLKTCDSPDDILVILRKQISRTYPSWSGDDGLTRWLNPTVNVIHSFSVATGRAVGQLYLPAGLVFTAIATLLSATNAASASRIELLGLLERIEDVFRRLETYINIPMTAGMTEVIVKVMAEVLCILAITTKEIKENSAKTFLKKLVGRKDIEDALQRLEKVITEEARMAAVEALNALHGIGDKVAGVDDKVHGVRSTLKAVEEMLQGIDGRVKDISNKVIDGADAQQ